MNRGRCNAGRLLTPALVVHCTTTNECNIMCLYLGDRLKVHECTSFRGACVWPGESTLLMCYGWLLLSSQFVFKLEQTTLQFSPLDARIAG